MQARAVGTLARTEEKGASMEERHYIAGPARGEPLPEGRVGARVRVPLSGMPSPDWSRLMTAHLTASLVCHGPVGYLSVSDAVQGAEIVLEGVEDAEAPRLGAALREAVEAANRATRRRAGPSGRGNMSQDHADRVAAALGLGDERPSAAQAATRASASSRVATMSRRSPSPAASTTSST
jgi:hypothetical protein